MSERQPDEFDAISAVMSSALAEVNTCVPGVVVAWDANRPQVADVQPVIQRVYLDDDGNEQVLDQPVITDAPVAWPQGGGFILTFPLKAGDPVMLVFSQRSIDKWLASDGKTLHDCQDNRRHHLSDAIVIPGLGTQAASSAHGDNLVLAKADDSVHLQITPGGEIQMKAAAVRLGADNANKALALAAETKSGLDALQVAFDNHTHMYVPGPGGVPPTAPPVPIVGPIGEIASTKVFASA